jgi:hypothetical protein
MPTSTEPRVIYLVQCPVCGYQLEYIAAEKAYHHHHPIHPYAYGQCVNEGKKFTFEQPTVRQVP